MLHFEGRHLAEFYPCIVDEVQAFGRLVVPRYKPCWELRPVILTTETWSHSGLPGVNYRFAYAELMALICGWDDVAWLTRFNSNIAQFSDDGLTFYGAYGPRMYLQFDTVINLLEKDPDSRQAVIGIWQPRDGVQETKDVPCNTHLYLKVRHQALHMTVMRRSADVIWGVPYDNFVFGHLLMYLAQCLRLQTGSLVEVIDSLHLYTPDAGYYTAARVKQATGPSYPLCVPLFNCASFTTLRSVFSQARSAVDAGVGTTGAAEMVRKFLCG